MTAATREAGISQERRSVLSRLREGLIVKLTVTVLVVVWLIPTIGLLISSFRSADAVRTSGWWTIFGDLFDFRQWTIQSYSDVIQADGMGDAFLNSLAVAIPVLAQVSSSYDLSRHVIAGGGGRTESAGYSLEGTIGQAVTGQSFGGYTLCSGHWCAGADDGCAVYLPLVLREY